MASLLRVLYFLGSAMRRPYWDSAKLRRFQEKRLRSVVDYAYRHVPFYHERLREVGVKPSDIRGLDDLEKLPIIRKSELKSVNARELVSMEYDIRRLKTVRTSGSTGQPFAIYLSKVEDDWRKAIYMRANISCGQKFRDRWVVITGPHHFSDTTGLQRRLGVFAQRCISVFSGVNEQVRLVSEWKPDVLDGYSGSLLLLAQEFQRRGLGDVRPKIVFGTAELIDDFGRKFIENVFGAPFYDQFGCAEVDRSAWQCPEKVGYHMDVDSVITEFVDLKGEVVSSGERGEVVYTSLFNYALPLIRYAVGDVGQPMDDVCPCGRSLPLMKVVEGKKDSFIVLPPKRVVSPRAFVIAMRTFKYYSDVEQFRIVQKRLDCIEFLIKKRNGAEDEVMRKELVEHFSRTFSVDESSMSFDVRFVDEIPLGNSGKLLSVFSEVKF